MLSFFFRFRADIAITLPLLTAAMLWFRHSRRQHTRRHLMIIDDITPFSSAFFAFKAADFRFADAAMPLAAIIADAADAAIWRHLAFDYFADADAIIAITLPCCFISDFMPRRHAIIAMLMLLPLLLFATLYAFATFSLID